MATLRKRGDKWHVQVRRSGISKTKSFSHKSDAQAWARKIEREIDTGDMQIAKEMSKPETVEQLLQRYIHEVTAKKRGAEAEKYRINNIIRQFNSALPITAVRSDHFARYRDKRLLQVSGSSVHRELSLLRHCFEVARREWGLPIKQNPVADVTMPETARARTRRATDAELELLRSHCTHQMLWQIITIAIETGMRRGEIINVHWDHIDWELMTLHIPTTKNGHPRTIPLTETAVETFQAMPKTDDRVFPMSGNAVRLAWERLKKKAGIEDLRFHDLRHEAVSRFFEMGLSVPEVALISGHRDLRMLHRYTHLKPEKVALKLRSI